MQSSKQPLAPAPSVDMQLEKLLTVIEDRLVTSTQALELRRAALPFTGVEGEAVIEIHLGGCHHADFVARVWPIGARLLLEKACVPDSTLAFLEAWLDRASPLARVPYIELEQDIIDGLPYQWVGPAIRPSFRRRSAAESTATQDHDTGLEVLRALPDWPPAASTLEHLKRLFQTLPAETTINMMSSLGARACGPRPGLRLILSAPRAILCALLSSVTSPGFPAHAREHLARYAAPVVGFDLELGASGLMPYFAFYRRFSNPTWSDSELRVFLDLAESDGLCLPAEIGGLRRSLSLKRCGGSVVLTFKLVLRETAKVRLKAYFEEILY